MPQLISAPSIIEAAGNKPKRIEEYVGHVNSGHAAVSVARMVSPSGWVEPGQRPEFEEITVVLRGLLRVEHKEGVLEVRAGHVYFGKQDQLQGLNAEDLYRFAESARAHAVRRKVGNLPRLAQGESRKKQKI